MDIAGVDVEIDVIRELPELEDLEVNPSTEDQSFNSSKYGFKNVIIKGIKGEELDLNPSTAEQNVEGVFTKVKVNAIKTQKLNTVPSTQEQVITGLFDEVTVNAIEGQELNLNPSEEQQNFEGVFLGVNINPIKVEEITTDLDFSSGDAIELTPQEGAYIKKTTINKPSNLSPENIKSGETVCGISGINADTSDADATSDDIIAGKTAYVANEKIAGTYIPLDTSDATATADDIAKDKTAYVNGEKVIGTAEINDYNAKIDSNFSTASSSNLQNKLKNFVKELNIDDIDFTIWTSLSDAFNGYSNATKITGTINSSNSTSLNYLFSDDRNLEECPVIINTEKVTSMAYMLANCQNLKKFCQLDASSCKSVQSAVNFCYALEDFGGLLNLGKAFTSTTANNSSYKLDLSTCTKLTHESLMNVINGLYDLNLTYDVANGGTLATQSLILGSTNLAKLTADEINIAVQKGWSIS